MADPAGTVKRPAQTRGATGATTRDSMTSWKTRYGRTVNARERLTAEGLWANCRAELHVLAERHNRAPRGRLRMEAEYLVTVARGA
jgi:hypothetical protein